MTHTLHRLGTEEERQQDFVVLIMPSKCINVEGSGPKVKIFLEKASNVGAVNVGSLRLGHIYRHTLAELLEKIQDRNSTCTATFNSRESVAAFLKELKEADLGISIVVCGVDGETRDICEEVGLKPHTVNHSLGVWGKTDKLPDGRHLMLSMMCGHGMVSFNLVKKAVEDVKKGKDPVKAAKFLAQPCHCALYNVPLAAKVLKELAEEGLQNS
ncbi:hypothetical protein DesLBE_1302 [Desulfitobacterium sp. LBE]|uniref:Uncharacterized protein n=1 Tax=Desulfitobacterium hafniense TaxID=49338 RepID=A0A0W1JFE9_DESHA|nr:MULTISPECIES: hypothetical protein [Desulfitobacterium]KTE90356.1 hypothetical protein AT727_07105 [Desulfitobacterium hafniense]TWH57044.1 hypothetical protein DesLBE_1302 [Desulfitobacterium sp. LBE]